MTNATFRKYCCLLLLLCFTSIFSIKAAAQNNDNIKYLRDTLPKIKADTIRVLVLNEVCELYAPINADSGLYFGKTALNLARKIDYQRGIAISLYDLGFCLSYKNDLTNALSLSLEALHIAEKTRTGMLYSINYSIAGDYDRMNDARNSLKYQLRANAVARLDSAVWNYCYTDCGVGYAYMELKQYDSALVYVNRANAELTSDTSVKEDDIRFDNVYSDLGEIYIKLKKYPVAIDYLRASIAVAVKNNDVSVEASGYNDLATAFNETGNIDSSIYYAKKAYNVAKNLSEADAGQNTAGESSLLLSKLYEPINKDSAYAYLKISTAINDSLFSQQKITQANSITYAQELHEQEQETEHEHDTEERSKNIEYAALGVGVILFMMLFIFLSPSITNPKAAKVLGILALLLVFEFIDLLIHPYIARFTNESPFFMLLILVGVALLIIPLHNKTEHWLTHRLIEKNNKLQELKKKRQFEKLKTEFGEG